MNLSGPIIIIENDVDQAVLLRELIQQAAPDNPITIISDSKSALYILRKCEKPFLIFSSINLCAINGFQLRKAILEDQHLMRKCNPFIFYAAHSNDEMVKQVYDVQASGYFHGINDYDTLGKKLTSIIDYWVNCTV